MTSPYLNFKMMKKNETDFVKMPDYEHGGDSGLGLYVAEDTVLYPFKPVVIRHAVAAEWAEGYELQIRPRSSTLMKRNIHVALGTIDLPYRGELMTCAMYVPNAEAWTLVTARQHDPENFFKEYATFEPYPIMVKAGERISQLVMVPVVAASSIVIPPEFLPSLSDSSRGAGGFGSTGL